MTRTKLTKKHNVPTLDYRLPVDLRISSSSSFVEKMNEVDEASVSFDYNYLPVGRYYFFFALQVLSASLSLVGSSIIIYLTIRHRRKRWEVYHRLLLALSLADVVFDISILLQFPMVRADTGHPLAVGNTSTCSAVGFTTTFTFSMVNLFFVVLAVYFLMTVRYGKNELQVRRWIEPYGYIFAIGLPLSICISGVSLDAFNPVKVIPTCFMRPFPSNCFYNDTVPCVRGGRAIPLFRVMMISAMITMVVGIVCTWLVYWTVRKQQLRNLRHSFVGAQSSLQESNRKRMRIISRQAICYTAVFMNGMIASSFSSRMESIFDAGGATSQRHADDQNLANNTTIAVFLSLYLILCPLQGLWNLIIYIRPSYVAWRELYRTKGRVWALQQIVKGRSLTVSPRVSHLVDGNINEDAKVDSAMDREDTSKTMNSPSGRSSHLWQEPPDIEDPSPSSSDNASADDDANHGQPVVESDGSEVGSTPTVHPGRSSSRRVSFAGCDLPQHGDDPSKGADT